MKKARALWYKWILPLQFEYHEVDAQQAKRLLSSADDDAIMAILDFSGVMAEESLDRLGALEQKATSTMGWATALVGFLALVWTQIYRFSPWAGWGVAFLTGAAAILALISIGYAFLALRAEPDMKWPSINTWLGTQLGDISKLRRFHAYALVGAVGGRNKALSRKGVRTVKAQTFLVFAGILTASVTGIGLLLVPLLGLVRLVF